MRFSSLKPFFYDRVAQKHLLTQFFKFCVVGVSNNVIGLAVYYALVYGGLHYQLAYFCAFIASVGNAYYWNSRFVFTRTNSRSATPFFKMLAVYSFSFLFGMIFLYLLVACLAVSQWIAPIINLCIITIANFLLIRLWAFRS